MRHYWTHLTTAQKTGFIIMLACYAVLVVLTAIEGEYSEGRQVIAPVISPVVFALVPAIGLWLGHSIAAGEASGRIPIELEAPQEGHGLGLSGRPPRVPRGETHKSAVTSVGMIIGFPAAFLMDEFWGGWPLTLRVVMLIWNVAVAGYLLFRVAGRARLRAPQ